MSKKTKTEKKKTEFSKKLLIQESVLIWIHTLAMLYFAYLCIKNEYIGELPWLTAMVTLPWAAYAVSQAKYYTKSQAENTKGGVTFETALAELQQQQELSELTPTEDYSNLE